MQPAQTKTPAVPTWKPTTAGILNIISGAGGIIGFFFLLLFGMIIVNAASWGGFTEQDIETLSVGLSATVFIVLAIISAVLGILTLIGGIFALKRKLWGLALAGSIASAISGSLLGILAIIFLAMSKDEFV
jgi:hypothetical protein